MDPLSNLLSGATALATGNPLGVATAVGGLGLSIFGGLSKAEEGRRQAEISRNIAKVEMQQDDVRRRIMQLSAHRQQIEVLRNAQRARSLALNSAVSQGAQFGSGLSGGYGQIQGAASWNNLGITQNLQAGEQMFDLNASISGLKMQMAESQSRAATAQGMTSLGGSLLGSIGPITNLSKQFTAFGRGSNSSSYVGSGMDEYVYGR